MILFLVNWQSFFNIETAKHVLPAVIEGIPYTLGLSFSGFLLGLCFGFFIALMKLSNLKIIKYIANIYISFMRGTPMVVLLFIIYFGLPFTGIQLDAVTSSIICFTMMSSAFSSEIIRSGLLAIDSGQWEAAYSLGLNKIQIFKCIILPQTLKICTPPLSNVLLDMVKGTSLTAMITVPEIFNKAKIVGGSYSDYMTAYIVAAFIYWIICTTYAIFQNYVENKLSY